MFFIEWNDEKMNLGIEIIDRQHKELFNLINQLTKINTNSTKADLLYIVKKLIDYSIYHFSTEEELFRSLNYNDAELHKEEHLEFTEKFKKMHDDLINKKIYENMPVAEISEHIYIYISNWIVKHILVIDKKYVEVVKENKRDIEAKNLTILYIEDEKDIRENFTKLLKLKVKNVFSFENGVEALIYFKNNNQNIDLILSDIEMPEFNGISLLREIRAIDKEIPFIVISAYIKPEYLLDSISHKVSEYLQKPVDIEEVFSILDEYYYKKINKINQKHQKEEIETYLSTLDNSALVAKTDLNGYFNYVNDIFCEISQYSKDEIIGKEYDVICHPDITRSLIYDITKTIKSGNKWKGRIKNRTKDGTIYFVSTTVHPLYEESTGDIIGSIIIMFLITELVNEKRKFKKNVITNFLSYKRSYQKLNNEKEYLEKKLQSSKEKTIFYKEQNQKLEKKYKQSLIQIEFYEKNIKDKDEHIDKVVDMKKSKMNDINDNYRRLLKENDFKKNEIDSQTKMIEIKNKEILKLNERLIDQAKIINDLRNTIKICKINNEEVKA